MIDYRWLLPLLAAAAAMLTACHKAPPWDPQHPPTTPTTTTALIFPPGHTQTEMPTTPTKPAGPSWWVDPPTSSGIGKG